MWNDKMPLIFLIDRRHNKLTRHKFILLNHKANQINSPSFAHSRTNSELHHRPDRHVLRSHHNLPHRVKRTDSKPQWRRNNKKRTVIHVHLLSVGKVHVIFIQFKSKKIKRGHISGNYRQVTVHICNLCSVLMYCRQGTVTFSNTLMCMFVLHKATHCGMCQDEILNVLRKRKSPSKANRHKSNYSRESFTHLCTVM
jgi:hypothetical protein